MKPRITIAVLMAALLMTGPVACGKTEKPSAAADTQSIQTETAPPETTTYLDSLPKQDLKGFTFRFIGQSTNERQNFYMEEKDGDVINDALHLRDQTVSDRLRSEFEFIALADRNAVATQVINTVLADDPAYEAAITAMSQGINTMVTRGVLADLNQIPYLSVAGGLWNASIHENMSFLGKQFFSTGVISAQFSQSPVCCVFNKRLTAEYKLDDIYDVVLNGKWTVDYLYECMNATARDLNGDGVMTIDDFYGFALDGVFGNVLYAASGHNPITIENKVYTVSLADAKTIEIIDKCAKMFGNPEVTWHNKNSDGSSLRVFREGRSIFSTCDMLSVQTFRDMTDDFGIIPTPKYEESQDGYITSCTTWLPTGVAVPKNCREAEKTGLVLETMAAVADEVIVPAVYEVTLQGKVSRDAKSSQMLDIIFENPCYDFITAFDFGGSGTSLRKAVLGWEENWVSRWESMKESVNREINDAMKGAR